jgi:hypothetical protein
LMHKESRSCPKEFQDRLAVFGQNPYGENLYKFAWGRTSFIRMGNIWRDKYGNERREYRPRCQNHEMQCWTLMRWKPASFYGSPSSYYRETWDATFRLFITGEYPWKGRYEPEQPFMSRELVDGKMVVEHLELNHYLIDRIIPMVMAFQRLSEREKQAAKKYEQEEEKRREVELIAEQMHENLPAFINPVSYSLQGCRTSVIDKKMEQIQKVWNRLTVRGRRPNFQRGFQVAPRPRLIN